MSTRIPKDELRGRKAVCVALFGVILVAQVSLLYYDWGAFRPTFLRGDVKRKVGVNSSSAETQLDDNALPNDDGKSLSPVASHLRSTGDFDGRETTTIPPAEVAILNDQDAYSNWSVLLRKIPISPSRFLNDHPRGLRLAFVGDSVTRYQAINLMYYLYSGRWFPCNETPSIVAKDDYDAFAGNETTGDSTWNLYLNYTSHQLGEAAGHHWCDCYRVGGWLSESFENRYFRDDRYDNYVYYVTKFGTKASRGRWYVPFQDRDT
jgi:hypothetical protein